MEQEVVFQRSEREIEEEQVLRDDVAAFATQMRLFAYPSSRRFPWATALALALSASLTTLAAAYWQVVVERARDVAELQAAVGRFASAMEACTLSVEALEHREIHRLLLPSLLRAGDQSSRLAFDAVALAVCGAFVERVHGSTVACAILLGGSVFSNAAGSWLHSWHVSQVRLAGGEVPLAAPAIFSTSGGVTAMVVFCAMRYSRCAALPGLPMPLGWLLAPILVANVLAAKEYFVRLREIAGVGARASAGVDEGLDSSAKDALQSDMHALALAIALAACNSVLDRARYELRPLPDDVLLWNDELAQALDAEPAPLPEGAFFADAAGALFALGMLAVTRKLL